MPRPIVPIKDWVLEICLFESLDSTQSYLKEAIANRDLLEPIAVMARCQIVGRGSRNNSWQSKEGNLYLSFALATSRLPSDLPLASLSIYAAFIMRSYLRELGEEVWVKWPNDIYNSSGKVGGVITSLVGDVAIVGIGINCLKGAFGSLEGSYAPELIAKGYLERFEKFHSWKSIFIEYEIEFYNNCDIETTVENGKKSLKNATLLSDGSIEIEGKRIYSLR